MSVFEGRNVDVAVAKAAESLGIAQGELRYEILAGKNGGFGLVRVLTAGEAAAAPIPPRAEAPTQAPDRSHGDRGRSDDRRGDGNDRRGDGNDRRGPRRDREPMPTAPSDGPTEVSIAVAGEGELSEIGQICLQHMERMLEEMGFGLEGTVTEHPGSVHFSLSSEAYGDVLSARGFQVLQALEHLLDKLVNVGEGDRKKIRLDINGLRDKQDDELGVQAVEMAKRAMDEGKVYKMGPLNPRARRLIHIALREVDGVSTESEGEGVFRRVCIIPDGLE